MKNKIDIFEIVVLSLTLFVLFSIGLQYFITINSELSKLLNIFEVVCCIVFIIEWLVRFVKAENKKRSTLFNVIDLIASIPIYYVPGLKAMRLIRIMKVIKVIGGLSRLNYYYSRNRRVIYKLIFFIIFIFLMFISPVLILYFEHSAGGIKTAGDALWWTFVTVTTIGYGDLYPVTTAGRVLTVCISMGGIALFNLLTALIIDKIINLNEKDKNISERELSKED